MTGQVACDAGPIDPTRLGDAIAELNAVMRSHAGQIALEEVSADGVVTVRFEAFCTGCPYRPATLFATIRPQLMRVPGVTRVEAYGSDVSEFAARRMVNLGLGMAAPVGQHTTAKG